MVRLIIFLSFITYGCEINSKQIIKPEKFTYDTVKFDTVSKILVIYNLKLKAPIMKL